MNLSPSEWSARHGLHPSAAQALAEALAAEQPSAFDVVTCMEMLEHVPDEAAFARELARVTRPGGLLVVNTPAECVVGGSRVEVEALVRRGERAGTEPIGERILGRESNRQWRFPFLDDTSAATARAHDAVSWAVRRWSDENGGHKPLGVSWGGRRGVGAKSMHRVHVGREGVEIGFWKIAMRPGRPMAFGRIGKAFLFGLLQSLSFNQQPLPLVAFAGAAPFQHSSR